MAENKTRPTAASAALFIAELANEQTDGGCLYVKKLEDIDLGALKKLTQASIAERRRKYPT